MESTASSTLVHQKEDDDFHLRLEASRAVRPSVEDFLQDFLQLWREAQSRYPKILPGSIFTTEQLNNAD